MSDRMAAQSSQSVSYRTILHSTALIGGSSVIIMFFALVRMKVFAILLGPAGIGTVALFSSLLDVAIALAGMGVQQSGVRQIAQAQGSGDQGKIAGTMHALARLSLILGIAGGVGLAIFAVPAAMLTFGSAEYALAVAALGFAVFFRIIAGGQTALLQGQRRIADLANFSIISAAAGVAIAVPMVFVWREAAIVPSLILGALVTWGTAYWYVRRIPVPLSVSFPKQQGIAGDMLRLGFAFLVSSFLTMGAAYCVRIIVLHDGGLVAAGLYQSAWAVAGLFVGVVLQAMGTDFYPRLTEIAENNQEVCRLVNEQTYIGLLIAGPGVLATITLAPVMVASFYSTEFEPAAVLIRWLCLGLMLRVISWPMGFIVLAKNWQGIFITIEVAATAIHVGLAASLVPYFGIDGAGVAFVLLYVCHGVAVYTIARKGCDFRLSSSNTKIIFASLAAAGIALGSFYILPFWWATGAGVVLSLASSVACLLALAPLVPFSRLKDGYLANSVASATRMIKSLHRG